MKITKTAPTPALSKTSESSESSESPESSGFSRRRLLVAALAIPALGSLIAACGDPTTSTDPTTATTPTTSQAGTADTTDTTATGDTTTPTTTPITAQADISHPTGADDVVFRLGYVGGFVRVGFAFTDVPSVLVTGDGRLITPGVVTAIYPGPMLPALNERTISEAGIQQLLRLADDAGLLAPPPDYSGEILVADAPDTVVSITANGSTFTHQAPALGLQDPNESEARASLSAFVETVSDVTGAFGGENLGEDAPVAAENYRILSMVVTDEELAGYDPAPPEVAWPAEIGVTLADASSCTVVPAEQAGAFFAEMNEDVIFTEPGPADGLVRYRVFAVALLPGDVC